MFVSLHQSKTKGSMAHTTESATDFGFERNIQKASSILRAISHPLRLKILNYISQNRKVNVNSIYSTLHLDQSITSQQLRILRDADVVEAERSGKEIYYSLNIERLKAVAETLQQHFG
jgi:ArsR family transcriptional regulator